MISLDAIGNLPQLLKTLHCRWKNDCLLQQLAKRSSPWRNRQGGSSGSPARRLRFSLHGGSDWSWTVALKISAPEMLLAASSRVSSTSRNSLSRLTFSEIVDSRNDVDSDNTMEKHSIDHQMFIDDGKERDEQILQLLKARDFKIETQKERVSSKPDKTNSKCVKMFEKGRQWKWRSTINQLTFGAWESFFFISFTILIHVDEAKSMARSFLRQTWKLDAEQKQSH